MNGQTSKSSKTSKAKRSKPAAVKTRHRWLNGATDTCERCGLKMVVKRKGALGGARVFYKVAGKLTEEMPPCTGATD